MKYLAVNKNKFEVSAATPRGTVILPPGGNAVIELDEIEHRRFYFALVRYLELRPLDKAGKPKVENEKVEGEKQKEEAPVSVDEEMEDEEGVITGKEINALMGKKKAELISMCEELGLSTEGTKGDLVKRIAEAIDLAEE